jgi:hypothetical protein
MLWLASAAMQKRGKERGWRKRRASMHTREGELEQAKCTDADIGRGVRTLDKSECSDRDKGGE